MKLRYVLSAFGKLNPEMTARIIGLQNQMHRFQFLYGSNLSQPLLAISDNLSETLQKESMSSLSDLHFDKLTVQIY